MGIYFEENRKISQKSNGHPGTEKTHIQTREIENHVLVLNGNKTTLLRGGLQGTV